MPLRLRQLSGREVAAALTRFGFEVVATRGSHCKLRRTMPSGQRQTLTIPLHPALATGTLHAIYRQACRFVPESELQTHFYSGGPEQQKAPGAGDAQPDIKKASGRRAGPPPSGKARRGPKR
jgi:predicted RNA binding protein YcfA (HicA-like mRNA interferase family)